MMRALIIAVCRVDGQPIDAIIRSAGIQPGGRGR